MDFGTIIILTIFVTLLYKWFKSYLNELPNQPPVVGRFDLPLQAKLMDLVNRQKEYVEISKKHGGIFSVLLFGLHKSIIINDWKIMKEALVVQSDIFSGRPYAFVLDLLGNRTDIATVDGQMWREKRRFTMHQLRNLGFGKTSMEAHVQNEVSRFIPKLERDDGKEIQMKAFVQMPILNILWGMISGKTYEYEDDGMKQLTGLIHSNFTLLMKTVPITIFPILRFVPFDPFGLMQLARELAPKNTFYMNEIEEHIRTYQEGDIRDFIDAYIEKLNEQESKGIKEKFFGKMHLVGIMENLFSAGVETTATTIEWALMYLSLWPEIQHKVQKELDSVIGRHRQPCLSDRSSLPYLEATLMEVQRYANVFAVSYHRPMIDAHVCGYTIPKTSTIIRNLWGIHNDKSLWGDPEIFRPERFINAEGKIVKPEYFIPFSTGARVCLGESFAKIQLFIFFASFMQRFTFSLPTGKPPPSLIPDAGLIQNPKPFTLVIKCRQEM